jgi:hypothetical protein
MRSSSVHCDRIIALIDACLDELAQEGARIDGYTVTSTAVEAEPGHEGGSA